MSPPKYELLYHPTIPGRGEFIRLAFEATATPYTDTTDPVALTAALAASPCFAPPLLRTEDKTLSQTANILHFLGPRLGLDGGADSATVLQLALTALDWADEAHNTHHPLGVALYYEDQREEARRAAAEFTGWRIGQFLDFFEDVLERNGEGRFLVGEGLTYADLVLWQVLDGVKFAFPKAMERELAGRGRVEEFYEMVRGLENVVKYLESGRRRGFGEGLFRHYPELDVE